MSLSSDLKIISGVKTVTTAGTREPLFAASAAIPARARSVTIKALSTNTDLVYVGDVTVSNAVYYSLSPGENITIEVEAREWENGVAVDLSGIYLDVAVNGEGVCYLIVRE